MPGTEPDGEQLLLEREQERAGIDASLDALPRERSLIVLRAPPASKDSTDRS